VAALTSITLVAPAPNADALTGTLAGWGVPDTIFQAAAAAAGDPNDCVFPGDTCQIIRYNNFIPDPWYSGGVDALNNWLNTTSGPRRVLGYSLGGAVITRYLESGATVPGDVTFVTAGNPYVGEITSSPVPLTEVIHEYEPFADAPDSPNLLALANSFANYGAHLNYSASDLTDPNAAVTTNGNVTHILVPYDGGSGALPLTSIFRQMGFDTSAIDAQLKPVIDSAYNREPVTTSQVVATSTQQTTSPTTTPASGPSTTQAPSPVVASSSAASPTTTSTSTATTSASFSAPSSHTTHNPVKSGRSLTTTKPAHSSASSATGKKSTSKTSDTTKAERKAERKAGKK